MATPLPFKLNDGQPLDDGLQARLRLAAVVVRCPVALVYRFEGETAELLGIYAPSAVITGVEKVVPAWRLERSEVGVVPVLGRGPVAPEGAIFPPSYGISALISAPLKGPDGTRGALILADQEVRHDFAELDFPAFRTTCTLVASLLKAAATDTSTALAMGPESLPPISEELMAWPLSAGRQDPVTGLPDREMLVEALEVLLEDAGETPICVALLSLDRFRRVDDWLGREVGDGLLRQVAERLLNLTSDHDLVGRGAGDEFIVVLSGLDNGRSADAMADRITQVIRENFNVQGYELSISASVGLSQYPADSIDPALLLRYAGIALHQAKERGRGRVWPFTAELRDAVVRRGAVERNLRRALTAGELELFYQPKMRLSDNKIVGAEALMRWRRGDNLISPGLFIPVAEESGFIVPLGTWALQEVCRQTRRWLDQGLDLEHVSVNVAALQFERPDFVGTVRRAFEAAGLPPSRLELEVTETSVMSDVDSAAERLEELRALGVRVSIDDFGTGYSSLAYLQQLPVDVLKIDRAFVMGLDAEGSAGQSAVALARAIVGLGHHLGLKVLAEGVETEAQLEALRELGCDEIQGYLIARPQPPEEMFVTLLTR